MKNKFIIAFFVFGTLLVICGALLKILHFEIGVITGDLLLTIGILTEVISGVFFIVKLVTSKETNEFLNK